MKMMDDRTMCGGPAQPLASPETACLILTSTTTPVNPNHTTTLTETPSCGPM